MVRIEEIPGSELEEKEELSALAAEAADFLLAHSNWCKGVKRGWFDRGFSKVAVFYFDIEPAHGADPSVWVIVGDLPPAFIDWRTCPNGAAALDRYVRAMVAWCAVVKKGESTSNLVPVLRRGSLKPIDETPAIAEMLENRMRFIDEKLLSQWPEELKAEPLPLPD